MTDGEAPNIDAGETPPEEPNTNVPEDKDEAPIIDATAYEAKIHSLTSDNAAKDLLIAQLNDQITKQKAVNYDLLTSVSNEPETTDTTTDPQNQDTELDIEDLFKYETK